MCRAALWLLGSLTTLLLWAPGCSWAQVGLRTAPLTAPRTQEDSSSSNSSSGLTLFSSRWMGLGRGNNTNSIESSLAAIFRGVAYGGASTSQPSSSSSTTTTTTLRPSPPTTATIRSPHPHDLPPRDDNQGYQPARLPVWSAPPELGPEVQQKAVTDQRAHPEHPARTPYVEVPGHAAPDVLDQSPADDMQEVEVIRAEGGVGMSQAAWVRSLGKAWVVHVYCAAGLYSLLALLALLWVSRVHVSTHLLPRGYYITLHLLMFLAAFLRCVHLFHDPYGAEHRLPAALSALVEETGWPCLTAALAVVVLAVVRAWRCPRLLPQKPYAPLALALLTATHLLASVATYLTSALLPKYSSPLQAAVRAVTAAWGGAIGIGGLMAMWRTGRDWGQLLGRLGRAPLEGCSLPPRHPRLALLRGSHLALMACFLQVLLAALHIYALVGPHYILHLPPSHPWHWLAYQSTCRALEVLMWVLLGTLSALSMSGSQGKRTHHKNGLSVLWCRQCGSCSSLTTSQDKVDEVFPALCQTNHTVRNITLQTCNGGKPLHQEAVMQEKGRTRRASTIRISHKRPSLRKSATLHSAASDIQLLWNQNQGYSHTTKPSDPTSRPSSMLVNDAGFVRFRMQVDPQQGMDQVLQKSLHNMENQNEAPDPNQQQIPKEDPPSYNHSFYEKTAPSEVGTSSSPPPKGSPRYEEPYITNQLEQLLQNRLNCELWGGSGSESGQAIRGEVASMTDYSSTDAAPSPPPTTTHDWSRYASTCSSISAANSFHVRMFDDLEVASYYHSPSSSSSPHVYATLHRPRLRTHIPRQRVAYCDGEPSMNGYEARQAVEQLTALLAPRTSSTSPQSDLHVDYLTDGSHEHRMSRGSDSDLCSSGSRQQRRCQRHYDEEQPSAGAWRQSRSRRINLHDLTPDSAVVVDYGGHTDDASGEEGEMVIPQQRVGTQQSPPRQGLLTKIVKNNFSLGTSGYTPLGTEDIYHNLSLHHQQALLSQAHQHQHNLHHRDIPQEKTERVRPCGHRPRKTARENPTATSPVRAPVHNHKQQQLPATDQSVKQKKSSTRQKLVRNREGEDDRSLEEDPSGVMDGATQTEPRTAWPAVLSSPSSSRPASSLASHSDLHSEYVDSEDETQDRASTHEDVHASQETSPDLATVDTWPSPTRVPAAV